VEAAGGGVVMPPEDAGALAGAIGRMADDHAAAAALGRAGRAYVEREYDREDLAARMLLVLEQAASAQ
jgi:hypothetical protein